MDSIQGEVETVVPLRKQRVPGRVPGWQKFSYVDSLYPFKIHTGADVTAISEEDYKKIRGRGKMAKPSKILRGHQTNHYQ